MQAFTVFLNSKMESLGLVLDIPQITNQTELEDNCLLNSGICLLAFLPNFGDSTIKEREKYLDMMNKVYLVYNTRFAA